MSRIPAKETLELVQGSTLDESWGLEEEDGTPTDLTGYTAELRIAKDDVAQPLVVLTSVGKTDPLDVGPAGGDGLYFDVDPTLGILRIYITDETLAGLTEADWKALGNAAKGFHYKGRNTLLFTNGDGETTVENDGPVTFQPIVEPEV